MELTRVLDILRDADGNPAAGKMVVRNPAFIAADGTAVAAGTLTHVIPPGSPGLVDMLLAPTEDADPSETSYTVNYFLKNGAAYSESWHIPRSGQVTISQARS